MKEIIDAFLFQIAEHRRAASRRSEAADYAGYNWHKISALAIEDAVVEVFTEVCPDFDEAEFRNRAVSV